MSVEMIPVVRTRGGVVVDIVRYSGTNALVKPRLNHSEYVANGKRAMWWAPLEWLTISEAPRATVKSATIKAKRAAIR